MKTFLAYTSGRDLADDYFARKIPVGLGLLGAVLNEAGFPAKVGNLSRFDRDRIARTIARERPDVLGVSVFTFNRHASRDLARIAREVVPGTYIVAGGPHVTHLDRHWLEAYPEFDAVVRGEGETALVEIVRRLAAGSEIAGTPGVTARGRDGSIAWAPPAPTVDHLDSLPHAADHLSRSVGVDVADQLRYMITSRGCPAACTFCNTPDFWGRRVRFRSVPDVMREIRTLRERHGLVYLSIRDDTFTAHRQRTIDFCRAMIDSGLHFLWDCQSRVNLVDPERLAWMKRAGCQHVQYGIESGSEPILQVLQKDITVDRIREAIAMTRAAGLIVSIYLISGVPEETDEDIEATVRLIGETLPHDGIVAPLAVYPGTRLYEDAKRRLGVDDSIWVIDRRAGILVREDEDAVRHHDRLVAELEKTGRRAAYRPADFDAFDAEHGFVFTTAMQRSEYWRTRGDFRRSIAAAEEIVRRQPSNPWGWLRLADLLVESGAEREAREARQRALAIVPKLAA